MRHDFLGAVGVASPIAEYCVNNLFFPTNETRNCDFGM
jgi:hypothetical protein